MNHQPAAVCRDVKHSLKERPCREYSIGEEIANSISHGIGAALAVAALVILIVTSVKNGGGIRLLCALVFGISLLISYLMSTLYHAIPARGAKRVFKVLDHCAIYLLIAATYTPFCLITLASTGGYYLAAFVWIVALAGMALEAFWTYRPRWVSALLYVLLGWSVIAFIPQLVATLSPGGLYLVAAGGACYTIGAVFYVLKKIPYLHFVFHLFVLAGSILQYFSVLFYVL